MFQDPRIYDLNIPTEAYRKQRLEDLKKKIDRTATTPFTYQPVKSNSTHVVRGTPAYAMLLKQRQQAIFYNMRQAAENQPEN
jgi:hypothetical protein